MQLKRPALICLTNRYHEMMVSLARIEAYLALPDAPCMLLPPPPHTSSALPQTPTKASEIGSEIAATVLLKKSPSLSAVVARDSDGHNGYLSVVSSGKVAATPATATVPTPLAIHWKRLAWNATPTTMQRDALRDVAVGVRAGALVGVVGAVGAGKTALLLGLLDELHVHAEASVGTSAPTRPRPRAVGYFSQEPHILNGTFEDNVTFGLPFEQEAFDEVVEAACLDADLRIMPAGSKTEIGEHGVNLSGGQKVQCQHTVVILFCLLSIY